MSRHVFVLTAVWVCWLAPARAAAQVDSSVSVLEAIGTYYLAGHAMAIPHELGHAGVVILTGGRVTGYRVRPLSHEIHYAGADAGWQRVAIRLAGPVANRLTADLPRWIHEPTRDGFYYRFTGAFAVNSHLQLLGNSLLSYVSAKQDMATVARTLTSNRTGQLAILTGITGLALADVIVNWEDVQTELDIMWGRKRFGEQTNARAASPIRVPVPLVTIRF